MLLLKNLLFTLIVPGTVGVYVPLRIADERAVGNGLWLVVASLLLAAGASTYTWCVWDFAVVGRGTPLPIDAPKRLVVRGLYRYSRNPMYVGVLSVILGWTALFHAPALLLYAGVVATFFHLFVVFYEEPTLEHEFGEPYTAYRARVGRWLPRLGRGRDET